MLTQFQATQPLFQIALVGVRYNAQLELQTASNYQAYLCFHIGPGIISSLSYEGLLN
jgi:hypothetical protein